MLLAKNHGWSRWIIESDSLNSVQAVEGRFPLSEEGNILEDINCTSLSFSSISFEHCDRNANRVSHGLARYSLLSGSEIYFEKAIPL